MGNRRVRGWEGGEWVRQECVIGKRRETESGMEDTRNMATGNRRATLAARLLHLHTRLWNW